MDVRTRMAPSPTGNLHIGTAYATTWSYLFARHNQGTFILRFEDTDQERSTKEFEQNIEDGLKWLKFDWDQGPFHQMDRLEIYKKYTQKLLDSKQVYYCFCSKEELDEVRKKQIAEKKPQIYSGVCRNLTPDQVKQNLEAEKPYVIRLKLPEDRGIVEFEDLTHGKVSFDSGLIGDMVIVRQNGIPLYNFAVVCDDIEMAISHVIRGDDHISNTPKQILLFEALNAKLPIFSHFPMILNQDRIGKLSKRTGSTSVDEFKREGYLTEAMFNYIVSLGWAPKDGREIFSKEEVIKEFELESMSKSAAAWNQEKLDWLNGEYIRKMSDQDLTLALQEFLVDHPAKNRIAQVVPLIKERIKKLSDFVPLTDFLFEKPDYDKSVFEDVLEDKQTETSKILSSILDKLSTLPKPWDAASFEKTFRDLANELNLSASQMFLLIRVAVSGQKVTPPLYESIMILGENQTLDRVKWLVENYESLESIKTEDKI